MNAAGHESEQIGGLLLLTCQAHKECMQREDKESTYDSWSGSNEGVRGCMMKEEEKIQQKQTKNIFKRGELERENEGLTCQGQIET